MNCEYCDELIDFTLVDDEYTCPICSAALPDDEYDEGGEA